MAGGTVESILVKEGDTVKAGDVLVRMNPVQARANAEAMRSQYVAARRPRPAWWPSGTACDRRLVPGRTQPVARRCPSWGAALRLQQQLFASRQAALRAELSSLDENIAGLMVQNQGVAESREGKREQLVPEGAAGRHARPGGEGYIARNRLLELERQHAQL
jgi:protease secretion system membrane fusion protein